MLQRLPFKYLDLSIPHSFHIMASSNNNNISQNVSGGVKVDVNINASASNVNSNISIIGKIEESRAPSNDEAAGKDVLSQTKKSKKSSKRKSENISDEQPIRPMLRALPQGHAVIIPSDFLPRNLNEITLDRARKYEQFAVHLLPSLNDEYRKTNVIPDKLENHIIEELQKKMLSIHRGLQALGESVFSRKLVKELKDDIIASGCKCENFQDVMSYVGSSAMKKKLETDPLALVQLYSEKANNHLNTSNQFKKVELRLQIVRHGMEQNPKWLIPDADPGTSVHCTVVIASMGCSRPLAKLKEAMVRADPNGFQVVKQKPRLKEGEERKSFYIEDQSLAGHCKVAYIKVLKSHEAMQGFDSTPNIQQFKKALSKPNNPNALRDTNALFDALSSQIGSAMDVGPVASFLVQECKKHGIECATICQLIHQQFGAPQLDAFTYNEVRSIAGNILFSLMFYFLPSKT